MQDVHYHSNKRVHLPIIRLFAAGTALAVATAMAFSAEAQTKDSKPAKAQGSASVSGSASASTATGSVSASTSLAGAPKKKSAPTTGAQAGFRMGFAMPQGKLDGNGIETKQFVNGFVPFWLDVGHRILPSLYVGAYAQYGYVMMKKAGACDSKVAHCTGQDYRVGLNIHYHFMPDGRLDPWVGIGAGYEWYKQSVGYGDWGSSTAIATNNYRGWELFNFQLGLDIKHSQQGGIGPFFAITMSKFDKTSGSIQQNGGNAVLVDEAVRNPVMHQWIMFGIQGSYYDDLF